MSRHCETNAERHLANAGVTVKVLAYNASKAPLNMFTVDLAYDLRDTKIKVNSASPGFVTTDMTGHRGAQTVEQGAIEIVRLAQLPMTAQLEASRARTAHFAGGRFCGKQSAVSLHFTI